MQCKPLTRDDRIKLAQRAKGLAKKGKTEILSFYTLLGDQIKSIEGLASDMTPQEALEYQSDDFMLGLFQQMIGGSEMTSAQEKNSGSSSDSPPPDQTGVTVETAKS